MGGLVISGGRVVDPASGMDAIGDVAVVDGKISAVGTGWAFVANAASSAAVLWALAAMRTDELCPGPRMARGRGQLWATFAYVRRRLTAYDVTP